MVAPGSARCLVRGSVSIDEIYQVKEIARPGETISSTQFERRPGGKGANQAVAIAKAFANSARGKVDLQCCVGEDGRWIVNQLEELGVFSGGVVVVKEPTGRAIIQVTESGQNSIILYKGANYANHPAAPTEVFSFGVTHLLIQNEIPHTSTLAFLAAAPPNVSTIFNPSPLPSPEEVMAFPWTKLTWLILNEHEAKSLLAIFDSSPTSASATTIATMTTTATTTVASLTTGILPSTLFKPKHTPSSSLTLRVPPPALVKALRGAEQTTPPDPGDPTLAMPALWPDPAPASLRAAYATALHLTRHPSFSLTTNVVCTVGAHGVIAVIPSLMHPIYMPAAPVRGDGVLDTTGAGDCFTGYLVAGLMERYERGAPMGEAEMTELLRRCVQAATICVERPGAMDSIPTAQEVDSRLS